MKLQTPSNVFDMTKCLMKLQEKYLESVRYEFNLSRIEIIILTLPMILRGISWNSECYSGEMCLRRSILWRKKDI